MDTKPKNDKLKNEQHRMRTLPFLLLWTIGHGGAWLLAILLYGLVSNLWRIDSIADALYVAFAPGIVTILTQILLVERGLKKSMRGWLPVSLAGLLVSAFAYYVYENQILSSDASIQMIVLSLLLPVALAQSIWLYRRVKSAWLWAVAAAVSALVFVIPLGFIQENGIVQFVMFTLAGILQGIVTGSTMRHLWTMEREKAKHESVQTGQTDEARLERLQESDFEADELPPARQQRVDSAEKILTSPGK
jgi:hypothetical protein